MKRLTILLPLLLVAPPVWGQTTNRPCKCQWAEVEPSDKKMEGPKCYKGPERSPRGIASGKLPSVGELGLQVDVGVIKTTFPTLKLCIDKHGRVENVFVLRTSGVKELDRGLCERCYRVRFRPPLVEGKPVDSSTVVAFHIYL
jgi:TonB family protein